MYVRATKLHAQTDSIDAGIAHFRDKTLPALKEIDGFVGGALIVDRDSGMCIATTNWSSLEARQASAETVRPVRDQATAVMNADSVEVSEWEIAGMHREHYSGEGASVRTTWLRTDPDKLDRLVDAWKMHVLPGLGAIPGFCSASMMVDRGSGRAVGTATFATRADLEAGLEQIADIRARATQAAGAEVVDLHDYDLAVAHLHEPEMV